MAEYAKSIINIIAAILLTAVLWDTEHFLIGSVAGLAAGILLLNGLSWLEVGLK